MLCVSVTFNVAELAITVAKFSSFENYTGHDIQCFSFGEIF